LRYLIQCTEIIAQLKRLNHALLFNFLELLETLITNPADYPRKVDDLELLLVNLHHLANSYRPHQARAFVLTLLEEQLRRSKQLMEGMEKAVMQANEVLQTMAQKLEAELPPAPPAPPPEAGVQVHLI
jgi:mediator of RNA polymerase II transcription subunit 7